MRIVYCLDSISRIGGIEKITVLKANALAEIEGNEIFVIVADHSIGIGYSGLLSANVKMVNLDVRYDVVNWRTRVRGNIGLLQKKRLHKRLLRKILYDIHPDIVISTGLLEKFMVSSISGNWIKVREYHFSRDYRKQAYSRRPFLDRLVERVADFYERKSQLNKYDHIVLLTNEDREKNWTGVSNLSVIPNFIIPVDDPYIVPNNDFQKTVIAVGRLTYQKNFSSLIRAFRIVVNRHPDWSLEIYGDGCERTMLQNLIEELHLENNVRLCGSTSQVQEKMVEASCFVLSSIYEGLPLVMLEAMSCGLPVVSYDCSCGPKDIITEGQDGFLVPQGDEQMLAERICRLIENPGKRAEMGAAARKKSENYTIEKIIPMWMDLFERLWGEKHSSKGQYTRK